MLRNVKRKTCLCPLQLFSLYTLTQINIYVARFSSHNRIYTEATILQFQLRLWKRRFYYRIRMDVVELRAIKLSLAKKVISRTYFNDFPHHRWMYINLSGSNTPLAYLVNLVRLLLDWSRMIIVPVCVYCWSYLLHLMVFMLILVVLST